MGKRVTRKEVITKKKTTKKRNEELGFRIVINNNGRKKTTKKENKKVIERTKRSRKSEPKKAIKKAPKSSKKEVKKKEEIDDQQCVEAIFEKIKKQKNKKEKKTKVKKVEKKKTVVRKKRKPRQSQVKKQLEPELPLHIPVANLNEISNKAIVDFNVIDIIMSIIEIGKFPEYYNKKNSNPETKSFWDYIIQQSEYRNIFNECNNENALNLSSDNLRRFFTTVMNIDSIKIVEIIKNNSDYLISKKDSLNLMIIGEYINDIVNGKAKTMNEIEDDDMIEETDEEFTNKYNTIIEAINKDFENIDKQTIQQILKKNNTNISATYIELQQIYNSKEEKKKEEEAKKEENKKEEEIKIEEKTKEEKRNDEEVKIEENTKKENKNEEEVKEINIAQETITTDMKLEECIIKEIQNQNEKQSEEKMDMEYDLN